MNVYVIALLTSLNSSGFVLNENTMTARQIERTVMTARHFYSRVGCEAVAHTLNRAAEVRAPKGDPKTYATCEVYDADDEI